MAHKLENPEKVLEIAAKVTPRGAYTVLRAAKDAGCNKEVMGLARMILRDGTKDEIAAVRSGEVAIYALGKTIRRGIPAGHRIAASLEKTRGRVQRMREEAQLYRALKDSLLAITGLPKPSDVVDAVRTNQRNDDIGRSLAPAIKWLKEFSREFSND